MRFKVLKWSLVLVVMLGVIVGTTSVWAAPFLPTSCQEIRNADPTATDGEYEIYPNEQVFTVYCYDMAGTPHEYLTLQNTGGGSNFSNAEQDATRSLTTWYEKVRIDPQTLLVDIGDRTFSTSQGYVDIGPRRFSIPYAIAFDCVWYYSSTGKANIDLSGTPFAVIDTFFVDGYAPAGTAVFSSADQVVDLQGGGYCGWIGPGVQRPDLFEGPNDPLELNYIGPKLVSIDIKPGSDPNCFNNDGHGVIPVAVLTTDTFDAAQVDPFSLSLDGMEARVKGKSGNAGAMEDVDNDGDDDLVVQIEDEDGVYETGDTLARLTGSTYGGEDFVGLDTICIVP